SDVRLALFLWRIAGNRGGLKSRNSTLRRGNAGGAKESSNFHCGSNCADARGCVVYHGTYQRPECCANAIAIRSTVSSWRCNIRGIKRKDSRGDATAQIHLAHAAPKP